MTECIPETVSTTETHSARNGRQAKCTMCGKCAQSSAALPFFESRAAGSRPAEIGCKHCWYTVEAHSYDTHRVSKEPPKECRTHTFESHGEYDCDFFYCGCRGWD
jgi:hypothetical protein